MGHATLLRRLLPPTSYDPNGARLGVSVDMAGKELGSGFCKYRCVE